MQQTFKNQYGISCDQFSSNHSIQSPKWDWPGSLDQTNDRQSEKHGINNNQQQTSELGERQWTPVQPGTHHIESSPN